MHEGSPDAAASVLEVTCQLAYPSCQPRLAVLSVRLGLVNLESLPPCSAQCILRLLRSLCRFLRLCLHGS